jgi:hypothetical protein
LPIGWNTVWNASPRILAKRGFDKVLVVQRPINDFLNACCWYDHGIGFGALPIEENARYLSSLVRIYDKLYTDVPVELPNVYHVFIENLNKATLQEFKSICSFLEFDMDKFPVIIPIKVKRDWEVYGGYNKSLELDLHLQKVKKARENDKNEC